MFHYKYVRHLVALLLLPFVLIGCSVNPVTGEKQLMFISETEEFQIGREQYSPAQQSQGGQYYLDPELTLYVKQVGQKLAQVSDRPDLPYEFVVLNNSVPNAWALPSGKIAINRGLLVHLEDEAQLAAVMGHEIVHAAARHSAQRMQQGMITNVAIAGLGMALEGNDYSELILGGAALGANLTVAKYGRDHELESDHYGMKYMSKAGYDLMAAVELQQLFVKLSEGHQSSFIDGLFASHPPSMERVEENLKTVTKFPSGNYRGKKEFDAAMSYVRSKMPAYKAQDEAMAAASKKDYGQALSAINKAIKIESNDASLYALRGDILTQQGKDSEALKDYNKAVALYPELFSSHLKRGEANKKLGNLKQAEADFKRSNELLPTSLATLELGELSLASGNKKAALGYYNQAAQSGGSYGKQAQIQIAKLELPGNPDKFTDAKNSLSKKGEIYTLIDNRSPVTIQVTAIETRVFDGKGKLVKKNTWKTKLDLKPGERSAYFKDPVANPLPQGYQVSSRVVKAAVIQ